MNNNGTSAFAGASVHQLIFTATDNGTPELESTGYVTINIDEASEIGRAHV